jgi:hypothetical protein
VPILFIVIGAAVAYGGWRASSSGVRWPIHSTDLGNTLCLVGGLFFLIGGVIFEIVELVAHTK